MKNKLVAFLLAFSVIFVIAGSINTANAYCWRGYHGYIHCNGWGPRYYYYYGPHYYHYYYGPRCRTWVDAYGYWNR